MPRLTSLSVDLRGNASSLIRAAGLGLRSIRRLTRGVGIARAGIAGLGAGVVGGLSVAGLASIGRASLNNVDSLTKLANRMGTTVSEVQKLEIAASLSGVKLDDVSRAFQRLTRLQGDAKSGSEQAIKTFRELGIPLERLTRLTPSELFTRTILGLGDMTDRAKRASVGNKLLEESWQRMNPFIEGFTANMRRASLVIDGLDLAIQKPGQSAVESVQDNLTIFGALITGLRDKVFARLAPDIDRMLVQVGRSLETFISKKGGGGAFAEWLVSTLPTAMKRFTGFATDFQITMGGINNVFETLGAIIESIAEHIASVGVVIEQLANGNIAGAVSLAAGELGMAPETFAALQTQAPGAVGADASAEELLVETKRQTQVLEDFRNAQFFAVYN